MSVEIDGQIGYEAQYLITIWIALLAERESPEASSVHIERSEDAEISLTIDNRRMRIAMQSKFHRGDFDFKKLAEWITHFPPRKAIDSLIEKLLNDPDQIALFVTKARCDSSTLPFTKPYNDWSTHQKTPLRPRAAKLLIEKVQNSHSLSKSHLGLKRQSGCVQVAKRLKQPEGRTSLQQIVVWEQVTMDTIKSEILANLKTFRIPTSIASTTTGELLDALRTARSDRSDLMPQLRRVLRDHASDRMLRQVNHVPREEEKTLIHLLETRNTVWITGRTQLGKTHTARAIAQEFQNRGVECKETDDFASARAFLSPQHLEPRLALLDDPLTLAPNPIRLWETLAKFANSLPAQHYLIVTAKTEHLTEIDSTFKIATHDSFGVRWNQMSSNDRSFLTTLWEQLSNNNGVPDEIRHEIQKHIEHSSTSELLQPGHLRHLANVPTDKLGSTQPKDFIKLARFNSRILATELLRSASDRRVCFALGIGGSTNEGIHERELAFLLSDSSEHPGLPDPRDFALISYGDPLKSKPPSFPSYEKGSNLTAEHKEQLRELQLRGFIDYTNKRYRFTHPDYREAFQNRILLEPPTESDEICEIGLRCLSALDPAPGVSSCRFYRIWFESKKTEYPEHSQTITGHAMSAMERSIFPVVRTSTMLLLFENIDNLSEQEEQTLLRNAGTIERASTSLVWSHGVAWINDFPGYNWADDSERTQRTMPETAVAAIIGRLKDVDSADIVSGVEADAVNTYFLKQSRDNFDTDAILALLSREETFIRADAAESAMSGKGAAISRLRTQVFDDPDPIVLARGLQAALNSWRYHEPGTKTDLLPVLSLALSDPGTAAISSRWLFDLGDPHSFYHRVNWSENWSEADRKELWSVWVSLGSATLSTLGQRLLNLNSGEFWMTAQEAAKWVTPLDGCRFATAWLSWIEQQTKKTTIDDYAASVAQFLLNSAPRPSGERNAIVNGILALPETDAVLVNIADLTNRWTSLSQTEQDAFALTLASRRDDIQWIRAVVLTRENPPKPLVSYILESSDALRRPIDEVSSAIPYELLSKCFQLLTGPAGYGQQMSVATSACQFWETVLFSHLADPNSSHFDQALSHLVSRAALSAKTEPRLIEIWANLCENFCQKCHGKLFQELFRRSLSYVGSMLGPLWQRFFITDLEKTDRSRYLDKIAENIEGISNTHDEFGELADLFGRSLFESELLSRFPSDLLLIQLLLKIPDPSNNLEIAMEMLSTIAAIYTTSPPRLQPAHNRIATWLTSLGTTEADTLRRFVEIVRHSSLSEARRQRDAHPPFEAKIENWVVQSRTDLSQA
ncbi:MAG: hypothetical protein ACI9DF_005464 [Verrucomicrobiales bacterium]|jgi:hypothetical protein